MTPDSITPSSASVFMCLSSQGPSASSPFLSLRRTLVTRLRAHPNQDGSHLETLTQIKPTKTLQFRIRSHSEVPGGLLCWEKGTPCNSLQLGGGLFPDISQLSSLELWNFSQAGQQPVNTGPRQQSLLDYEFGTLRDKETPLPRGVSVTPPTVMFEIPSW